jgi:glycosyltransferase, family 1
LRQDILFLGGLFPKEWEQEMIKDSKGAVQNAANTLQWNMIKALESGLEEPLTVLNAPYIGSYPQRYRKLFIPGGRFSHTPGAEDESIRFCNLAYWKYYSIYFHLKPALKRWAEKGKIHDKAVMAYALTGNNLKLFRFLKRHFPEIRTVLAVPDLPEFMNLGQENKGSLFHLLKHFDIKFIYRNLKYTDKFILLTDAMNERIQAAENDYVVMEGIAPEPFEDNTKKFADKTMLYTGGLAETYGVVELCEAFHRTADPGYRLILCGSGQAEEKVKHYAKMDRRISYLGLIERLEARKLQRQASVLVNPRRDEGAFTAYSFPSKILEYMSSGTPVMMRKLKGIPAEYMNYCYPIGSDGIEGFSAAIDSVLSKSQDELTAFGAAAQQFVTREKSAQRQGEKLLRLLED